MRDDVEQPSVLSDDLLRQLMAVGQVDILVGLPTLDNAATVVNIVRAIHVSFTRDFPRLRTVMINSDGGSTDGTQELIRDAWLSEADMVLTSHSLRTLHRVVVPFHGQPGKISALRTGFAAAVLTQAKAFIVLDPAGPATSADRVTELIRPILEGSAEFLAPRYRRHPRDGLLVTQLARPLVRTVYRVELDEPLGVEFSCSAAFASHCLEHEMWNDEAARFAIDLWLRTEAVANGFPIAQIWRPFPLMSGPRARLREAVQQVVVALFGSFRAHEQYWLKDVTLRPIVTMGADSGATPAAPDWDFEALAERARNDIAEIRPLLAEALDDETRARLLAALSSADVRLDDGLWVRIVYDFVVASHRRRTGLNDLASIFAPLYLWRAACFMADTAADSESAMQRRLDTLCDTFEQMRPMLVHQWMADEVRSS